MPNLQRTHGNRQTSLFIPTRQTVQEVAGQTGEFRMAVPSLPHGWEGRHPSPSPNILEAAVQAVWKAAYAQMVEQSAIQNYPSRFLGGSMIYAKVLKPANPDESPHFVSEMYRYIGRVVEFYHQGTVYVHNGFNYAEKWLDFDVPENKNFKGYIQRTSGYPKDAQYKAVLGQELTLSLVETFEGYAYLHEDSGLIFDESWVIRGAIPSRIPQHTVASTHSAVPTIWTTLP